MFKFLREKLGRSADGRAEAQQVKAEEAGEQTTEQVVVRPTAEAEADASGGPRLSKLGAGKAGTGKAGTSKGSAKPELSIILRQQLPMRARPEVLYRMALVPTRRSAWDSSFTLSEWAGDGGHLADGEHLRFRLNRGMGGLRFEAKLSGLKPSKRGGWRSVRHVGPLDYLEQHWTFERVQAGPQRGGAGTGGVVTVTMVTLTISAAVRYAWVRPQMERLLMNMLVGTLTGMQREVDAPAAQRLDEMTKRLEAEEKAKRKAEKAARKSKKKKR